MALLIVSFVAGLLTVLAPCILPLLPIIIGGTVAGKPSAMRAVRITLSLGASIFVFTLLLKVSTALINVPPAFWQWLSGGIVFVVGLFMVFPSIWENLVPARASIEANKLMSRGAMRGTAWGDIVVGAALGPVFSSCSPTYFILLASVLPVHPAQGLLYLLAYVVGLSLGMFLIAFLGQRVVHLFGAVSDPRGWFKRIIGILFILLGLAIIFGLDKKAQALLPASAFGIVNVEQTILQGLHPGSMPDALPVPGLITGTPAEIQAKKSMLYPRAPELAPADAYLNTDGAPINLAQYRGKNVVLIDFWTYSCINCQRTLPYLTTWYQKYKDQGLVIIGIHTPEFSFEHVEANVADALKRFNITYPVLLDNEYQNWNAFGNQYWPREYLIDIDGFIVHDHAGEGEYDVTEKAIQAALAERAQRLGLTASSTPVAADAMPAPDLRGVQSPETYFGAKRNEFLGNGTPYAAGLRTFTLPSDPDPNTLYLRGAWDIGPEYATSENANDTVLYRYSANDVYIVASADASIEVEVLQDGAPVGKNAGADVDPATSTLTIQKDRLYTLVHNSAPGPHTLELRVKGVGLHAYTFTFG